MGSRSFGITIRPEFGEDLSKADGRKFVVFTIKNEPHADYWQQQAYPVMLVTRTSDGDIRWMDVREHLKSESNGRTKPLKQIVFEGEPLTALNLRKTRDGAFNLVPESQ